MSDIPKPAGFDFRVRLEQRPQNHIEGSKWEPKDALYSAHKMLDEAPPRGALLVCWYTPDENGRLKLKFQGWQEHDCQMKSLSAEIAYWLCAP
jgi:hypothetical protein